MLFQLRTTSILFSSCTNKHLKGSVPDTWTYHYIHDMTESLKIRSTYPLGFYFPFWYAFSSKLRFSFSLLLMTFKHKIPWNTRNKGIESLQQNQIFKPHIFKTRCCKPLIFQTQIIWSKRIHSLKNLRSATFGSKDIVIRKSEYVLKTQFLCRKNISIRIFS